MHTSVNRIFAQEMIGMSVASSFRYAMLSKIVLAQYSLTRLMVD